MRNHTRTNELVCNKCRARIQLSTINSIANSGFIVTIEHNSRQSHTVYMAPSDEM